jgi:hypothetical protein
MMEGSRFDKTRRTFIKGAAATEIAATGITAFSSSAAAQPNVTVGDDEEVEDGVESYSVQDHEITIQRGNRNAQFQNVNVTITDVDEEAGTASGTVSGSVLPTPNANQNAARDFNVEFADADVIDQGEVGNPTRLITLVIPDLFLDVLGLQISLDLELLVDADPEGGLLGRLLDALLG